MDKYPQQTRVLDLAVEDYTFAFRLFHYVFNPRPVVLISSISEDGVADVAPFSYVMPCGHDPPLLAVALHRWSDGEQRRTLKNIRATRNFIISVVTEKLLDVVNASAARREAAEAAQRSKFEAFGIPAAYKEDMGDFSRIPFVEGSQVQLCCQVERLFSLSELSSSSASSSLPGPSDLLIARVLKVCVNPALYHENGVIDIMSEPSVGRVGLDHFIVAKPSCLVSKPPPHRERGPISKL